MAPIKYLLPTLVMTLAVADAVAATAGAEDPPAQKRAGQADLTEGLMDLLREPTNDNSTKPLDQPSADQSKPVAPPTAPLLDGEDIGQGPSNPLAEVQLGMRTLAQWMRGQRDVSRTKELQRDIVLRLDDMIVQLEKQSQSASSASANSSSENSSSQSSTSQRESSNSPSDSPSSTQSAIDPARRSGNPAQPAEGPSSEAGTTQGDSQDSAGANANAQDAKQANSGGNNPEQTHGQPGISPSRARSVKVDLNDPRALQRSAWGNLPERMREQMQSRMVERFLPPYRDEIEAYYRALVK